MNDQPAAAPASQLPVTAPKPLPCTVVIFGANGDLTKRLVTPALYNLALTGLLPDNFAILGLDHNGKDDVDWRQHLTEAMQGFVGGTGEFDPSRIDEKAWGWLTERMYYLVGDFEAVDTYDRLREVLEGIDEKNGTAGNVIFYLAVADRFFGRVVDELGKAKLVEHGDGRSPTGAS